MWVAARIFILLPIRFILRLKVTLRNNQAGAATRQRVPDARRQQQAHPPKLGAGQQGLEDGGHVLPSPDSQPLTPTGEG